MNTNEIDYGNYYQDWPVYFYQSTFGITVIILTVIFFLVLIIFLLFLIFRSRLSKPENIAKKALKNIKKKLEKDDKLDVVYLELTKTLKNYIQKKYKINYIASTDLELLYYLENISVEKDFKSLIRILISNAEKSKYAFKNVSKKDLESDINNSFLLIDNISKLKKL